MSTVNMPSLKSLINIFNKYPALKYFLIFELAFLLFSYLQLDPSFPDPDSFYHTKIALLIKEQGIVKNFPYFQATVLKDYFIDHHFLYHLLLVPFIIILPPLYGVKFATIIFAGLTITAFYWLLSQLKIKGAFFYSLILIVTDPFIFRINLAKAQAIALIIFFISIYLIVHRRYNYLFILSFLYVWLYGGWPLILVLSCLYVFVNAIFESVKKIKFNKKKFLSFVTCCILHVTSGFFSKQNVKLLMSAFGGVAAGLIINPYFPKNLYFYWQQIFQIAVINYKDIINVGGEWYPYNPVDLVANASLAFIVFIVAATFFALNIKKQNILSVVLLILTAFFIILTIRSRRNVEYLIPVSLLFSAFSLDVFLKSADLKNFWRELKEFLAEQKILIIFFIAPLIAIPYITYKDISSVKRSFIGISFDKFRPAMQYLADNSNLGDIVFHSDWDESPILFYHNSKNYYLVGLDPTFMYKYSQELYSKWERITTGKESKNLAETAKSDFSARFVFISLDRHENMAKIFSSAPGFERIYQDKEAVIYQVTPSIIPGNDQKQPR